MKITMLETAPGSPDGVQVNDYDEGETYDVPQDLADTFIRYGLANAAAKNARATDATEAAQDTTGDQSDGDPPKPAPRKRTRRARKDQGAAPENKAGK